MHNLLPSKAPREANQEGMPKPPTSIQYQMNHGTQYNTYSSEPVLHHSEAIACMQYRSALLD